LNGKNLTLAIFSTVYRISYV